MIQDLSSFRIPDGFRGRSAFYVQLWWLVQSLFFRGSPQYTYGFRRWLLRCFGAQIGVGVLVRPTVTITYPWKVKIGDNSWIGDDVTLYSLGEIIIENDVVISQKSYLCAADHDYMQKDFPLRARSILIGSEVWIATDVYVGPGVTVGQGSVIGARSSVFEDIPPGMVCVGSPCQPLKLRDANSIRQEKTNGK